LPFAILLLFSSFQKLTFKSDKIKEFAANVHFLSFKKGGKIQTGLNCKYDGLSEACLSLSHSSSN
jgi:hypothetical protein